MTVRTRGIPPACRPLAAPLLAGVLYFVLAASTIHLTDAAHGIATVWPANAVLLAMILRRPQARWWPVLLAGFLGNAAANVLTRGSIEAPLLFGLANIAEVMIAAWGLQRRGSLPGILSNPMGVWRFIAWGGLIAPGLGGVLGAATSLLLYGNDFVSSFLTWLVADGLGLLIVTPFLIAVFDGDYVKGFRHQSWSERIEAALLLTLTAGLTAAVFQARLPMLFLVSMPLMLVTFRVGWLGTKLAMLIVAVIGGLSTMMQMGPLARIVDDPDLQVLFFQFYLAALLMTNMPVAAALAASRELTRKLEESDRSFRLLTAQSPTLLLQFDRAGICRKALGAGDLLAIPSLDALVGRSFAALSQERAVALRAAHAQALEERDGLPSVEFRPDTDGDRWLEATFSALIDEHGACSGTLASVHNITARKHHATALARSAMTDSLTGVLNRAGFMARLGAALVRPGEPRSLALALIDIDRFKLINDNSGHLNGDVVLREVASRIGREIRAGDSLGRLGGDEFVILIDASTGINVEGVCARVVNAVDAMPVVLPSGGSLRVAISCGVARHRPGQSAEDFLGAADAALYEAKRSGRNRVVAA
jgi:diguanylate cyclase (GGDEF)-like protein